MPEPLRVVTGPLRLSGAITFSQLAAAVAADAMVRRAWSTGRQASLLLPVVGGHIRSHYAFERELAREGHDRSSLAPDEYELRSAEYERGRRASTSALLAGLGVLGAELEVSTTSAEVVRAARTAFVTLFEQGHIEQSERVVGSCPRCRTSVDGPDVVAGEMPGHRFTVRLLTTAGQLDLPVVEVELLPGVVAVAVPESDPSAGGAVMVPVANREVPVVVDPSCSAPWFVVAAHDPAGYALALGAGLTPIPVLDDEGVVAGEGPIAGLARYAAREAARELLAAEGALVRTEPWVAEVSLCGCCGTVLVPRLGRHWFLRSGELEVAAADAVRDGVVTFSPPEAREVFLDRAGARVEWCLSCQVPGGVALPASRCLDCGSLAVETEPASSCGKCMGALAADTVALDARFVAAAWALGLDGWPGRGGSARPEDTVVVVTPEDLEAWVVPVLGLGLRLVGSQCFGHVTVHPWPEGPEPDPGPFLEPVADCRVLRLALLGGTADLEPAQAALDALDAAVAEGGTEGVLAATTAGLVALGEGSPAQAAGLLVGALAAGVPAEAAERLRALARPVLGD